MAGRLLTVQRLVSPCFGILEGAEKPITLLPFQGPGPRCASSPQPGGKEDREKRLDRTSLTARMLKELQELGMHQWASHRRSNEDLVSRLQSTGALQSQKAADAMRRVDRGLFVPSSFSPYDDTPQPMGFNATISAPHMHAHCLTLLEGQLKPGAKVLDVGSGSGYLTAAMALMVGETGRTVGVEHIPELVERSISAVQKSDAGPLLEQGSLSFHVTDGRAGWPDEAPYDAIHVGAAAPELPEALVAQLKPGGRMVIPVGRFMQGLDIIDKHKDGSITSRTAMGVRYVPLTGKEAQLMDEN